MRSLQFLFYNPLFLGAISGLVSAASVDFVAFRSWKSFSDAYAYDWPIAFWRWFQGTVVGLVTALGIWAAQNGLAAVAP